jgi:hypothetical protein
MLQEVLEDDDFLQVSSAGRLVNILGTVSVIGLTFLTGEIYGFSCLNGEVYSSCQQYHGSRNWNLINISGTKRAIYLKSLQGERYESYWQQCHHYHGGRN